MKTQKYLAFAIAMAIAAPAGAQVMVNEFCASNDTLLVMGQTSDWIELYNSGNDPVNLKGYALSDNPKKPGKYVIDKDIQIYPQSYRIVLCNGLGSDLNTSFKLSGSGSEYVVFSDPDGQVIDEIAIPELHSDYSYGRVADGSSEWGCYDVSTPGYTNAGSMPLTAMPEISVKGGFYAAAVNPAIKCSDPRAEIYYTTDGSLPTAKSAKYSGAINVKTTKVLRAVAISPGMKPSPAATATYFINLRKVSLPVVSLSTDRANFYDDRKGIYVAGTNGIKGNCQDFPKNWNQPWERPVHIEYFDKAKKLQLSQDAGIKITGSCSRGNDMKSLRVVARKQYGDNRLRYKFFDKKELSEFKSIVLRNGGNDFGGTMLRDALITGLAGESLDVDVQAYQPAAVFLNGEYLGLHNIREKVSTHFVEENYGADADCVDLLENNGSLIDGSASEYKSLISFVRSNDLSNQANYDKVAAQIDVSNFIDYWCAQIYVDNEDWPNNNIKYYKTRGTNAKWRWVLFGAEYSCGIYGGHPDVNSVHHSIDASTGRLGSSEWGGLLMRKLLQNQGFKNQFIQRMAYTIDRTFNPDRVYEFLDSLITDVQDEWQYHGARWFRGWHEIGAWFSDCNNLMAWFVLRPQYIREHVRNYFGLGNSYGLEVEADCAGARFSMNGSMASSNINGQYFSGVPISLEAKLPKGLEVDHWEISGKGGEAKQIFGYDGTWSYFDSGKAPAASWKTDLSDGSGWKSGGIAPLGFSPSWRPATNLQPGPENSRYSAYYFRKKVSIGYDPSKIASASITIKVDDGAVVYLNGKEQGRYMMGDGAVSYNTWASSYVSDLEEHVVALNPADFVNGDNIVAIEVHQANSTSSDLWMEAKMEVNIEDENPGVDKKYGESVSLNLASDTKVTLITKAAKDLQCENRSVSAQGAIVINEVATRNAGTLADETSHYPAWVEFYNASDAAIDMAGLYVMDAASQYRIDCGESENTMIPAHGRLVFFLDGRTDLGASHLGINLATEGETALYLGEVVNGNEQYVDWVEIPKTKKGCSYGRKEDGSQQWIMFQKPSPYQANSAGEPLPAAPLYTAASGDLAPENLPVVEAFPNPAMDFVRLDAGGSESISYELLSMGGQLLLSGQGNLIDIQALPSGMYLLRVDSKGFKSGIKLIKK